MVGGSQGTDSSVPTSLPGSPACIVAAIWPSDSSMARFESGEKSGLSRSQARAWASATAWA